MSQMLSTAPTSVVYSATDMPPISVVTIGLIASTSPAVCASTPESAMMKPITVPSRPSSTRLLAICRIDPIREVRVILSAEALIAHMQRTGVKTVGFIGYNDPYGEAWSKTVMPMFEKAGIKVVANERYNRADTSVTGQVLKLKGAAPDAVFVESPFGTPLAGTDQIRGYWQDLSFHQSEVRFASGEIFVAGPWFAVEFTVAFRRRRTGDPVEARGGMFCETREERIAEMRLYWHRRVAGREALDR